MSTINQLIKKKRKVRIRKSKSVALGNCPQKKGHCLRVFVTTPRKPNSALRKVARILLCNNKKVTGYIRGIGHTLQKHSAVLIQGGNIKDLPGIKYRLIRGKYDFRGIPYRMNGRSKYGTKKLKN